MNIVHLTASPFFGGPERQMLGIGLALPAEYRSIYVSFSEGGRARPFLNEVRRHGLPAHELTSDTPRLDPRVLAQGWSLFSAAVSEVADLLEHCRADVLCCHGYKADLVGWRAGRKIGVPVMAVSRGWTAATLKVRCYEWLDRLCLFDMDRVVCVSHGQAEKVRRLGLVGPRVEVIHNAVDVDRFARPDPTARADLEAMFPRQPGCIVAGAGRFSPEKGFPQLVEAAGILAVRYPEMGLVLFGDGPERSAMQRRIAELGLAQRVIMPGFRSDLDRLLPAVDILALPSYTEGLPNVVLEACAARVPVVATAVGGTPEVVEDGANGFLVRAGQAGELARRIGQLVAAPALRRSMGERGFERVRSSFSFAAQAQRYQRLWNELRPRALPLAA